MLFHNSFALIIKVSGLWGMARKLNYTFEIMAAFCWCSPGLGYGIWPFLYAIFLTILLM